MEEPKSLDSLFKEKIFRIPDYQRGYAWQVTQLKDFWEDLINLSDDRAHYTGVLTLNEVDKRAINADDKEFWLVDDHSYRLYHIVDGQQRLTTFIIFLQAFVEFIMGLPDNQDKPAEEVYITDSLNVTAILEKYLYKVKPTGDQYRTYKFGYTEDNPSYEYLRYRILNEEGAGSIDETFYTLNLKNAKIYFAEQFAALHEQAGLDGLRDVYKKLTRSFMFNEYVIRDAFDVFVAFETMNNRGKKLSDLELLKNRLIYLTTLYSDAELDEADRRSTRERINETWKEVYYQLGRNEKYPLSDDEFLRAHWIMYFKYSRQTGRDYARFLLDERFSPRRIHKKVEALVELEQPEEQVSEDYLNEIDNENGDYDETEVVMVAALQPTEIKDYVDSLKTSSTHWFTTWFPGLIDNLSAEESQALDRLNRVGIGYFRPLVMATLKNVKKVKQRLHLFDRIERFIFLVFRMNNARANYGSSDFYNAARALDRGQITLAEIESKLASRLDYMFNPDMTLKANEFYAYMDRKFTTGSGYFGWAGLRYFLYEYELSLLSESRQKKVDWSDLLKTPKDKISIEHIYPQTPTEPYWKRAFAQVSEEDCPRYTGALGNLLLLSMSINSSLQNDSFDDKKKVKLDKNKRKIRNGYSDGSHSEIEVSQSGAWGPAQIRERSLKLLDFLENRWDVKLGDNREKFLFLPPEADQAE